MFMLPLTPEATGEAVLTVRLPELAAVPEPDSSTTEPPIVFVPVLFPPVIETCPPTEVPAPAEIRTMPPIVPPMPPERLIRPPTLLAELPPLIVEDPP